MPSLTPNTPPAPPAAPGSGASDELADPKTGCKIVRADNEPNISITWSASAITAWLTARAPCNGIKPASRLRATRVK